MAILAGEVTGLQGGQIHLRNQILTGKMNGPMGSACAAAVREDFVHHRCLERLPQIGNQSAQPKGLDHGQWLHACLFPRKSLWT